MPDLLPADHPDFIPKAPIDLHVANIQKDIIDVGCAWYIERVGRIPQGMHGFVIPYTERFEDPQVLKDLIVLLDSGTVQRMFCPQPAFKITETTDCPEFDSPGWTKIKPNTPYIYAFQTFNAAGKSALVGNFNRDTGEVFPVTTLG
jgi:hypothetical protein